MRIAPRVVAAICLGVLAPSACTTAPSKGEHPPARTPPAATAPASSGAAATPSEAFAGSPSGSASTPSAAGVPASGPSSAEPCGWTNFPAHYSHVLWIWMENASYRKVMGNPQAPYENSLARRCGLATDYHGVTHPSLPNYLAATGGSTFGVADDAGPRVHPIAGDSIFGQVTRAGLAWRSYEESMPQPCDLNSSGRYAVKHNPAAYYTDLRSQCAADDVPLDPNLDADLAGGHLPAFAFVTPNLCHDMHDCSVRTGDSWLAARLPAILDSPQYRVGSLVVVLTFDEGEDSANHVATIVIAPTIPAGTTVGARLDHYALLRGTEELLGLAALGAARSAPSLARAFGLQP